ncbi:MULTISPECIES: pit accessory protein [Oleiagrimonas]|uniref:Pit accessory protein n=1 Tax=Oleiagrimonas citrea TaxID=1665687 RepID=A0A846ZPY2_9GAMM|nr:pit accessory protein [Oleiagrimonas sp. MCCC 1A03011]NKZ39697.1 pit accessory protein [Oleiagrimonas citrea]RAP59348.1 pit accessory protein [Oleiagrimonas sp. MCCC 1A03011]
MFSLQTIFGKGDKFYGLLEQSADAARESARAVHKLVSPGGGSPDIAAFSVARKREKDLAQQISEELVNTFVTALDREDIEALNAALYKIPKTVEKFAERYAMISDRLHGIDFTQRTELLVRASDVVREMIGQLRKGMRVDAMRRLQDRLQALESEADRLLLEPYREMYVNSTDPVRMVLAKDLYELLERAIDKCRDVGNVTYSIVLKNS